MTARLICSALLAGLTLGCATSNDTAAPEPRSAEAPSDPAAPQARALTLEGDVDPRTVKALAKHLEALADVQSVEIAIHKTNEGPMTARLTLGGFDMPSIDELQAAVADFELEGDVTVSFDDAVPMPQGRIDAEGLAIAADDDKTPEEVKAQVIEQLRADGVEGEILVDVIDEGGERRVEVRVENHAHVSQPE